MLRATAPAWRAHHGRLQLPLRPAVDHPRTRDHPDPAGLPRPDAGPLAAAPVLAVLAMGDHAAGDLRAGVVGDVRLARLQALDVRRLFDDAGADRGDLSRGGTGAAGRARRRAR